MGVDDNGDLGFQQRGGKLLNCLSSGMYTIPQSEKVVEMTMGSMPMCISSNAIDSFFGSDWDPHVSLEQNVELKGSSMVFHNQIATSPYGIGVRENQGTNSTSHFVQYPSDASLMDLAQKLPCFGSGSFSKMINSFGLAECGQIVNAVSPPDYPSKDGGIKKTSMGSRNGIVYGAICQEERRILDEGTGVPSPNEKKRKRMPETHSEFDPFQSKEGKQQKDLSRETLEGPKEIDEKKQKTEQNPGTNLHGKVMGKQAKDHSQSGEASKDDYIHVRARRGMATNSHSLAERVRREKISERMRFLQDLVPGCNKITGKAVMLDEIINYVQSLQQQVEFLSMKLATVNPELNIDLEQLLSKDILHSRGGSSAIFGFSPGMSTSFLQLHRTPQGATPSIQHANPCLPPMSQVSSVWDDELQSVMQMGFVSSPVVDSLGLNGCTKVEL